jgi:acetyltransferase-like isoleucine patch superfamily enzyme
MPPQSSYPKPPSASKQEGIPPYRRQPLRIDPPQGRPVLSDDDRNTASTIPTASVASPDNKLSAMSAFTNPANVFPTPISAVSSAMGASTLQTPLSTVERKNDYQRVPPLHDLTRTDRNEPETPHPGSLPHINILHPTRASSPIREPPSTTNPQVAAQLALSHPFPSSRQRTQKEEMLLGRQYFPFDTELVLERQRCSAACWRFNNSTNPNTGVSGAERSRLFQQILNPKDPVNISPQMASPVTNVGRVGQEVVVEAPFTCDYGYNISIGNNVFVGRNCTILDPCEIKIGDNCFLGPNVSLFGATLYTDPKRRQGSKSAQIGSKITISEDVWIGGGVIVLPGVKIGKGAAVGAGSVVTKDVPPYTVVAGNPARVTRGVQS